MDLPEPPDLAEIIARAKALVAEKEKLEAKLGSVLEDLAKAQALLIAVAEPDAEEDEKGTRRAHLVTDSGECKLTWPVPSLKLTPENYSAAKTLAGQAWPKIAERIPVTHKLLKAARDLIPALLPKAAAEKLLEILAAEPAAPRLVFS